MPIPNIDSRVKYVGASALRGLNVKTLRELKDVMVIQVDERPAAVVVPYDLYMRMQEAIWPSSLLPALEKFLSGDTPAPADYHHPLTEEDERKLDLVRAASSNAPTGTCPECHRTLSTTNGALDLHDKTMREELDNVNPKTCVGSGRAPVTVTVIGTDMTPRGAKFARVDDSKPPVFDDVDEPAQPKTLLDKVNDAQMEYVRGEIKNRKRLQGSTLEAHGEGLTGDLIQKTIDDLPNKKESHVTTLADDGAGPRCHHCGKLNASILCSDCFLAGHRNGSCLRCAETTK